MVVSNIDLLTVHFILITLRYYILQISCNFTCTTGSWCVAEATPPDTWNTLWTSWQPLPSCLSHGPSPAYLISHGLRSVNSNLYLTFSMRHLYEWLYNCIWSLEPASTVVFLFFTISCCMVRNKQLHVGVDLSVWLIEDRNLIRLLDVQFPYTCRPK